MNGLFNVRKLYSNFILKSQQKNHYNSNNGHRYKKSFLK